MLLSPEEPNGSTEEVTMTPNKSPCFRLRRVGWLRKKELSVVMVVLVPPPQEWIDGCRCIPPEKMMAQLPCIGLSWPLTNRHLSGVAPSTFTMVYRYETSR